jgi:hypothetical protein
LGEVLEGEVGTFGDGIGGLRIPGSSDAVLKGSEDFEELQRTVF